MLRAARCPQPTRLSRAQWPTNSSDAPSRCLRRASLSSKTNHCWRARAARARSCATELQINREGTMSDKERQKKDGRDKNKKNQAMREANKNQRLQTASAPSQAKDQSNLADTEPGAAGTK